MLRKKENEKEQLSKVVPFFFSNQLAITIQPQSPPSTPPCNTIPVNVPRETK
ncbi:hypothetical protein HMPREF0648_1668 [Prevotella bivia JCVIHMP010]|nr:hypothetical protein HMPREF0648_1668 [Prevotella bivia JCVIHMP010]